jgi:alkanesulfonate monooxygenase SsuD/methylene tetrahydromethanopterin reductase-like flavin-dependent oxidoreductase (luciferase family)
LEEQVEVMRRLWSEPVITVDGDFHHIQRAGILPHPPGPIPIWFGGGAEPMLRRAARLGDGFIFGHAGPRAVAAVETLQQLLSETGRDVSDFGFEGIVDWAHGPDAAAETAATWAKAGGTHLSVRMFDTAADFMRSPKLGFRTVDQHLTALGEFRQLMAGV